MTILKPAASGNRLLAALPVRSRQAFVASCEYVELEFAEVLCESGEPIRYVYFPVESFISLVTELDDGHRLEVGIVGDEGMLGMSLVLGVTAASHHALVQGAGGALRIGAAAFNRHLNNNADLRLHLNRYVCVLLRQLALTSACSHYHLVEARLARWLLMTRDRAHSSKFHITHQFLAYMLGVRRVGITEAATTLHNRGLIDYKRGEIAILDDAGLSKTSCRCYQQGNDMYEQLLDAKRVSTRVTQVRKPRP